MTDWTTIDYDDPCAVYQALRSAYYELVAGGSVRRFRTTHGDTTYEKEFDRSPAGLQALRQEMTVWQQKCAAASGGKSHRAIIAG